MIVMPTQKKISHPPTPFGPTEPLGIGEGTNTVSIAHTSGGGGGVAATGRVGGVGVRTVFNGAHSAIPSFHARVISATAPLLSIA